MILGNHVLTFPGPEQGGVFVSEPSREEVADVWYNPGGVFDAFIGDIYAWRAKANLTTWGAGPANYAASKIDENNGVVLGEGNGAVPWAAATGWGFVAGALQYFLTGIVPVTSAQQWSMFVQFNATILNVNAIVAGQYTFQRSFLIGSDSPFVGASIDNGNRLVYAKAGTTNAGCAGNQAYKNGASVGIIPIGANDPIRDIYIGALNAGGAAQFATADIAAVWICRSNPAIVQGEALALATAMSQL